MDSVDRKEKANLIPYITCLIFMMIAVIPLGCERVEDRLDQSSITVDSLTYQFGDTYYHFRLDSLDKELYQLRMHEEGPELNRVSTLTLPYPVYQLQAGDLDRDNCLDLFLGVIKPCRYDSVSRKRLFIYTLEQGHTRSKWMGTYLANDLLDFHILETTDSTRILTLERDSVMFYRGIYAWGSFGPRLVSYFSGGQYEKEVREAYMHSVDIDTSVGDCNRSVWMQQETE